MSEVIFFSLSDIVKKSAAGILYNMINKKERVVTPGQILGDSFADMIYNKMKHDYLYREIGSFISLELFGVTCRLYYSLDMYDELSKTAYEIKSVFEKDNGIETDTGPEEWYFNSSLVQSSLLAYLSFNSNVLNTSKFWKDLSGENHCIKTNQRRVEKFVLIFGDKKYDVYPSKLVYLHYINKIEAIMEDYIEFMKSGTYNYNSTKRFDGLHKHIDINYFKNEVIAYRKIRK